MDSWLEQVWHTKLQDWTFDPIPPGQVRANPIKEEPLQIDEVYLTVTMASMHILSSREWWTKYFGAVHCFSKVYDRRKKIAEFHVVTTPSALEAVDSAHLDHIVMGRRLLLGPVVYRGGFMLEIGLFSVVMSNLAAPYVSLLESLSKTAGVAFVGAAGPIVGTIKTGIGLLSQQKGQAKLEIGYAGEPEGKTGYYVLARVQKGTVSPADWEVDADGRLKQKGKPVTDFPYVVFTLEASKKRDDWFMIPEVAASYEDLQEALQRRDAKRATECFEAFRVACYLSHDLIPDDATRLIDKIKAEMARVMPGPTLTGGGATGGPELPALKDIKLYG